MYFFAKESMNMRHVLLDRGLTRKHVFTIFKRVLSVSGQYINMDDVISDSQSVKYIYSIHCYKSETNASDTQQCLYMLLIVAHL